MIDKALQHFNASDYHTSTVIGEFSGRDSVAAILKAFEDESINYILPIATFSGTEYGDYNSIYENYIKTKTYVDEKFKGKKILYPLIEYNRSDIWHMMNGKVITQLNKKYGFYNPCIGCHLYFHLTKLPFASMLSKRIISGERASHDGRIKVNQLELTLSCYKDVLGDLGYELLMPLEHESSGDQVQNLIGWTWDEGADHPKCILSGNYRDSDGRALYDEDLLKRFLKEYIGPIGDVVGRYLLGATTLETVHKTMKELL